MSSIIPGLGQLVLHKFFDGLASMLAVGLFATGTVLSYQYREYALTGIFAAGSILFYGGSIYGAYHETKIQNKNNELNLSEYLQRISFQYRFQ